MGEGFLSSLSFSLSVFFPRVCFDRDILAWGLGSPFFFLGWIDAAAATAATITIDNKRWYTWSVKKHSSSVDLSLEKTCQVCQVTK